MLIVISLAAVVFAIAKVMTWENDPHIRMLKLMHASYWELSYLPTSENRVTANLYQHVTAIDFASSEASFVRGGANIDGATIAVANSKSSGPRSLHHLANFPHLRRLGLGNAVLSKDVLRAISRLQELESLDIASATVDPKDLTTIAWLPSLNELYCRQDQLYSSTILALSETGNIQYLLIDADLNAGIGVGGRSEGEILHSIKMLVQPLSEISELEVYVRLDKDSVYRLK